MTKRADTDPTFPAPPANTPGDPLDSMLDELARPQALDHKATGASSEGRDAVEYSGEVRPPAPRVDHNTFPDAPVIVHQTDPGLGPAADPLRITAEERRQLEQAFARRRGLAERVAETEPRKLDPPPVTTEPASPAGVGARKVALGALALLAIAVAVVLLVRSAKPGAGQDTKATASASTASVATDVVPSATARQPQPSPTASAAPGVTATEHPAPAETATARVAPIAHVASTATAHAAPAETATAPPPTVSGTSEAPTTTATVTAPPGFKPSN